MMGNLHLFWTTLKWFMSGNEIKSETIAVQRGMWRGSEDKRQCRERDASNGKGNKRRKKLGFLAATGSAEFKHRLWEYSWMKPCFTYDGRFSPSCAQIGSDKITLAYMNKPGSALRSDSSPAQLKQREAGTQQQCNALVMHGSTCHQCWKTGKILHWKIYIWSFIWTKSLKYIKLLYRR